MAAAEIVADPERRETCPQRAGGPMPASDLNLEMVAQVATDVARDYELPIAVVGTVPSAGGSKYVEIVLRIEGCHRQPWSPSSGCLARRGA